MSNTHPTDSRFSQLNGSGSALLFIDGNFGSGKGAKLKSVVESLEG